MLPHILQLNGKTPALKCRAPHVLNRYSFLTLIGTQKKKDINSRTDHDTRCLQLSMVSFGALLPLAALQKAAASPHPHTAYPGYARLLCSGIEQIGTLLWLETFAFLKLHFLERRSMHTCCRSTSEFKTELPTPLSHLRPPPPTECLLPSAAWSTPSGYTASIPIPGLPQQTCALILNYLTTCKSAFLTLRSPSEQPLSSHPSMQTPLTSPSHCPIRRWSPHGSPLSHFLHN